MGKRHVAVLCVNVRGFVEGFYDDRDWVGEQAADARSTEGIPHAHLVGQMDGA